MSRIAYIASAEAESHRLPHSTAQRIPLMPIQISSSRNSCRSQALASITSVESELDLAAMVRDFIENGGDEHSSEEGPLSTIQDELKALVVPSIAEQEFRALVRRAFLSGSEDIYSNCLKIVQILRAAGYNAGVCKSQWRPVGRIPGGEYEYVDVVRGDYRLILDLDFRSHFKIARPVQEYKAAVKLLPKLFIGSARKLKEILVIMSKAAKESLSQNSMHLPPWRTLHYLSAKWLSPYQRVTDSLVSSTSSISSSSKAAVDMKKCYEQIKRTRDSFHDADGYTERRGNR